MLGATLLVVSRLYILVRSDGTNFGVIDVGRSEFGLIMFYWLPFFAGAFCILVSAYLAHVEVVHQWFSLRLTTLETWVTGTCNCHCPTTTSILTKFSDTVA